MIEKSQYELVEKLMVSPFVLTRNVKMQFILQLLKRLPTQKVKFERHCHVFYLTYVNRYRSLLYYCVRLLIYVGNNGCHK